jgi:hypothetical protein
MTLVSGKHPAALLRDLSKHYEVRQTESGIYQVKEHYFPMQVVISEELTEENNIWLADLKTGLTRQQAEQLEKVIAPERQKILAYLNAIVSANRRTFLETRKMTYFEQLMADYLEEKTADAVASAVADERILVKTQEKKQSVLRALEIRFKTVPKSVRESIESYTDLIALDSLHALAITCESVKEFKQALAK